MIVFFHLAAPPARKKLELQPRSADASAAVASGDAKGSKSNPFGAAKPIDSDEVIRRVEEKLNQEQQEKKAAAEKARKEKESKEKKDPSSAKNASNEERGEAEVEA